MTDHEIEFSGSSTFDAPCKALSEDPDVEHEY